MREKNASATIWDKLGISLSVLCAIHCLTFPILFSLLPLWHGHHAAEEWIHVVFLILIIPTIYLVMKGHHIRLVTFLLIGGFSVLVLGLILGFMHFEILETVVTVIGSVLLISGHFLNYRSHQIHTH